MCVVDEMGVLVLVHIIMEFLVPKIVFFFKWFSIQTLVNLDIFKLL